MTLPAEFLASLKPYAVFDGLEEALCGTSSPVSVRVNARKPAPSWLGEGASGQVPWCDNGFYLPARRDFTRDPAFHQGRYYVQEAASMFHAHIAKMLTAHGSPIAVLDACAAPGGKTTAVMDNLPSGSLIVANERSGQRVGVLRDNVVKHGRPGVVVSQGAAQDFAKMAGAYDLIVADAPCSGEGMMRKEPVAVTQWSPSLVEQCAGMQRDIVERLWRALRPGGHMVYSTCTFNRRENEEVVQYAVEHLGAESVEIPGVSSGWGVAGGIDTPCHCYRFIPGLTATEGLFVAVLRKPGEWRPQALDAAKIAKAVGQAARVVQLDEKAALHARLMSWEYDHSYPECEVDLPTALDYLRGNAIRVDAPRGMVALTYEGQPLGLVKNLVSRANNLYPQSLRIRSTY